MALPKSHHSMAIASVLVATIAAQGEPQRQTFAPHEMNEGDAPAPIVWPTPPLPDRTIKVETAEERNVRVVVVTDDLEQPWSMVFLPDGGMLVTERAGRVRLIRNGKLESKPIRGVPRVYTGGPRGLQGLMDIALHPSFRENGWVYLTYDKPSGTGGSTALARGRWNGVELVGVQELFDSEARDTEASRLAFGRDRIRADRNDVLYRRSIPSLETKRLCRRSQRGRHSAYGTSSADCFQRALGRAPTRAAADAAEATHPRRPSRA